MHNRDEDCLVNHDTGRCVTCGVIHSGPPCPDCGAKAFHVAGCSSFSVMAPFPMVWGLVQPGSGVVPGVVQSAAIEEDR